MSIARRALMLVGSAAMLLAACGGGDDALVLDGSVFDPDEQGILSAVSPESVTIDGTAHRLGDELLAFSAGTLAQVTIAGREGHYVFVGLEGGRVEWLAFVGDVLPAGSDGTRRVLFPGRVSELDDGRITFDTGLRLAVADGVKVSVGEEILAVIDPSTDTVIGRA